MQNVLSTNFIISRRPPRLMSAARQPSQSMAKALANQSTMSSTPSSTPVKRACDR